MLQQRNTLNISTLVTSIMAIFRPFHFPMSNSSFSAKRYLTIIFQQATSFVSLSKIGLVTNLFQQEAVSRDVSKEQAQEIQQKRFAEELLHYVETNQVYQQPELSLIELAQQMETTPHYLSKVINQQLNCNFIDFINQYRVKMVQEKLLLEAYSHYTILSIGFDAGFNSKSAFYSVFKKHTGTTPSQYRKQATFG